MRSKSNDLTGLVVCGGSSSRMGEDKSLLEYHGIPQRKFLYNLLKKFCGNVFISLNPENNKECRMRLPVLLDDREFRDIGPVAALLSFWKKCPGSAVFAAGCDYPFVNDECLNELIAHRKGKATCFINPVGDIYEPLLTIYESSFHNIILQYYNRKEYSLSRILKNENANAIEPLSEFTLMNVNTQEEYITVKEQMSMSYIKI